MFEILLNENNEADKREKVSGVSCLSAEGDLCTRLPISASCAWKARGRCPWEWGKIGSELIPLESGTNHKKDQAWGEVTEASQIAGSMTSLFKIRYFVQCETFDLWFWLKSISLSLTCLDIRFFLLPPYILHQLGISNLPHYRFGPKKHWHIRIMLCLI